jgi:hypothetical protein
MLPWLKQNWLALCSLVISVLAFVLAYKKFRHDTRPALILRRGSKGMELENIGPVVVYGITLTLIERVRRPSGRLSVVDTLRPGESSPISAFDLPEELTTEFERNTLLSFEETMLMAEGQRIRPNARNVASYLLSREGRAIIVLRFRARDESKTFVRLFRAVRGKNDEFIVTPSHRTLRNRVMAAALEKLYRGNGQLAPPFGLPPFQEHGTLEEGKAGSIEKEEL